MRFRTRIRVLLLCWLLPAPISCWAGNLKVLVVLSDNSAPYQSFANALNKSLPDLVQTTVLEDPDQLSLDLPPVDLIVAVGTHASELVTSQDGIPVLAVMIPQTGYENLVARISTKKSTRAISAIYLDQPWVRRIDFLHAALPDKRKVGLLHSPDSRIDILRLRQNIAQRGGSLIDQAVATLNELFPKLENVLASSDVIFAIPDNLIYNTSSIRNILLTSYRHGIPLIGLSQAYVNAGALCAIFSTPQQMAEQTSAAVVAFARTGELSEPQYSSMFTIAVNQQVARSLGIEVASPEAIRDRMER